MAKKNGEPTRVEKALSEFVSQLVARMEEAAKDLTWNKGWAGRRNFYVGLPQNIKGNTYIGGNAFLLQLLSNKFDYSMPVFMTFNQARDMGVKINKGARSADVFKWGLRVYEKETGKRISESEYDAMTKEEKEKYRVAPYLRTFIEFNIDQTNFKEVYPDRYKALLEKFKVGVDDSRRDTSGMYVNEALDKLIHNNGAWICPIHEKEGSDAYYLPSDNEIYIPAKADLNIHKGDVEETFKDGQEYYSIALHEMAHSTGHESQLNRPGIVSKTHFGSPLYAKEELVAELTAAMVCNAMGYDKRITENSAAYLKGWAEKLKQDPRYIVTVMSDVNKSSRMELEHIDAQRKALGQRGLLEGNLDGVEEKKANEEDLNDIKSAQEKVLAFDAEFLDIETPYPADQLQAALIEIREDHPDHPLSKVRNVGEFRDYFKGKDTDVAKWVLGASVRQLVEEGYLDTLPNIRLRHDEGRTTSSLFEAHARVNVGDYYRDYYMSLGEEGQRRFERHLNTFNEVFDRYESNIESLDKYGKKAVSDPRSHVWVARSEYIIQGNMEQVEKEKQTFYYAAAESVNSELADDFNKARTSGESGKLLAVARDWVKSYGIETSQWMVNSEAESSGLNIVAEDEKLAVAYHEKSGVYDILPKLTRAEILDDIRKNGLDSDASEVVKGIAYEDIARQFSEIKNMPVHNMPNGEELHLQYNKETNKIEVGNPTNVGLAVSHEFDFDMDLTLDENLETVNEELFNMPEYQAEEQEESLGQAPTEEVQAEGEDETKEESETVHEDESQQAGLAGNPKESEEKSIEPRDEKRFFVSYAFMQFEEDTRQFDKLAEAGDYDGVLNLAGEYDQSQEIDLHYVSDRMKKYQGDDLLCENDDIAVVYNGVFGGTYDLLRKHSENEIREAIEDYGGLEYNSRPDFPKAVWEIQRNMVEDEWSREFPASEVTTDSGKTFKLSFDRENDKILVSDPEHLEQGVVNSIPYDYEKPVKENFGYVYEEMCNLYPERETQRTVLPDTEKMAILKNIVKFAEFDTEHPLHDVSNMSSFKETFSKATGEELYGNYVEERSVMDYNDESLGEVKDFVASASQETLLEAGVSRLRNYHYPHHEGRTYSSMINAMTRIEDIANANVEGEQVKKRLGQAYDIYATYRKRTFEGMSEAQAFEFISPQNNEMIPRSHYADGIRSLELRTRFCDNHSESFDLRLPTGEVKHMHYNVEKDAYDIGHFAEGNRKSFVVEDSYPVKDYDMDETIELYRYLTGITEKSNAAFLDEWKSKVPDGSIEFSDGLMGKVKYFLADDTIEVRSEVSDYEDYDVRIPYDHRVSVEENLKRVADVLAYNGYEISSYPIDLTPSEENLGAGNDVVQGRDQVSPTMKEYVESLKDTNEPLSGDYSKLPKDSEAYKAWQENEDLAKEYDRFVKDPSSFDYQERSELFADLGSAGLKLSAAVAKAVEEYKGQQTAHEDSNIETNVAAEAKRIASTGVPMAKAEKIAKENADDRSHAQKHEEEKRQAQIAEEKKAQENEKEEEEQKSKEEKPSMAVTHASILLAALAAAKADGGYWMNKGRRESSSLLFSNTAVSPYNDLVMGLHAEQMGYRSNIYTFYDQAKENKIPVMRGQDSLPFSWTRWEYAKNSDKSVVISSKEFHSLSEEEKKNYTVFANRQHKHIYNIDQTIMPSKLHDDYVKFVKDAGDKVETLKVDREAAILSKYNEITRKHPDCIVVMSEGDCYRAYRSSADNISKILGIPVSKADYIGKEVSFIEFPKANLDRNLQRFIESGKRTAIVDELADPRLVKSVVDDKGVSSKVQSFVLSVAKTDGMACQRVMEDVRTKYDERSNTLLLSGMSVSGLSREDSAIQKANDAYRALAAAVGNVGRLDRGGRNHLTPIDDAKYDRLVQELTAGVILSRQGLPARMSAESMQLIPYWEREIKENPRMMGIIERDVNNTVEVLEHLSKGEKPDYSKLLGNVPKKDLLLKENYSFIDKLNGYPDMVSKEIVVVKDVRTSKADVILPAGASLEANNEVSGMRKDRITIALKKEGITDVRFYNAGGALGMKVSNEYFKDKEISVVRLNRYELLTHDVVQYVPQMQREKIMVEDFKVIKDDDGKYFFHIKPVGEKSFDFKPAKTIVNSYFSAYKTKDAQKIAAMRKVLSEKIAELASEHPDVRENFIMPKVSKDIDMGRITRANITTSAQDSSQKIVTAVIDGQRHTANITMVQWNKMWNAENMADYKKAVAAVVFEPVLRQGANQGQNQGQDENVSQDNSESQGNDVAPGVGVDGHGDDEDATKEEAKKLKLFSGHR